MTGFHRLTSKHSRNNRQEIQLDVQVRGLFEELRNRDVTMQQEMYDCTVRHGIEMDRLEQRLSFAEENVSSERELAATAAAANAQEMMHEVLSHIAEQQQSYDIESHHQVHNVLEHIVNRRLSNREDGLGNMSMMRNVQQELAAACASSPMGKRGSGVGNNSSIPINAEKAFGALPPSIRQQLLEDAHRLWETEHRAEIGRKSDGLAEAVRRLSIKQRATLGHLSASDREKLLEEAEQRVEAKCRKEAISSIGRKTVLAEARRAIETEHESEEKEWWDKYNALNAHDHALTSKCDKLKAELREAEMMTELHDKEHEKQLSEVHEHDVAELEEARKHWETDHKAEAAHWRERLESLAAHDKEIAEQLEAVSAHDRALAEQLDVVSAHDRAMATELEAVSAHDKVIAEEYDELAEHDKELEERYSELSAHDKALEAQLQAVAAHDEAMALKVGQLKDELISELQEAEIHEQEHIAKISSEIHDEDAEELAEARQRWESIHNSEASEWREQLEALSAHDKSLAQRLSAVSAHDKEMVMKAEQLQQELMDEENVAHEREELQHSEQEQTTKRARTQLLQIAALKNQVETLRHLLDEETKLRSSMDERQKILDEQLLSAEQGLLKEKEAGHEAAQRIEELDEELKRCNLELETERGARISWKHKAATLKQELAKVRKALGKVDEIKAAFNSDLAATRESMAKKHEHQSKDDIDFLVHAWEEEHAHFDEEHEARLALEKQLEALLQSGQQQNNMRQTAIRDKEKLEKQLDDANKQMQKLEEAESEKDRRIAELVEERDKLEMLEHEEHDKFVAADKLMHTFETQCQELKQTMHRVEKIKGKAEEREKKKVEANEEAKAKVSSLTKKVKQCEKDIIRLENAIKEYQEALDGEEKLLEESRKMCNDLQTANAALEKDLKRRVQAEAEGEASRQKVQRASVAQMSEHVERILKLEEELDTMRQNLSKVKHKYQVEQKARKQAEDREQHEAELLHEAEKKLKEAKKKNKTLKDEKNEIMVEAAAQAEVIEQKRKLINRLENEVDDLTHEIERLDLEHRTGQEKGQGHVSTIGSLEDELKQEKKLRAEAEFAMHAAEDKLHFAQAATKEAESRILELQKLVDDHNSSAEQFKDHINELKQNHHNEKLAHKQAKEAASSDAQSLEAVKQTLKDVTKLQEEMEHDHEKLTHEKEELEKELHDHNVEISNLKVHVEELETYADELEQSRQKEEKRRKKAEKALRDAEHKLAGGGGFAEQAERTLQLEQAIVDKRKLEDQTTAEREAYESQAKKQNARMDQLETEIKYVRKQWEEAQQLHEVEYARINFLEKKLAESTRKLDELHNVHHHLEEEHEKLSMELQSREHKVKVADSFKSKEHEDKVGDLLSKIQSLQRIVDSADSKVARAEAGRKAAEERLRVEESCRHDAENWRDADNNFEILKLEREVRRLKRNRKEEELGG